LFTYIKGVLRENKQTLYTVIYIQVFLLRNMLICARKMT